MKKLLLTAVVATSIVSFNANASDKHDHDNDATTASVQEKAIVKTNPDRFAATIEFTFSDYSAKDAQADLNTAIKKATDTIKKSGLDYKLNSFNTYKEYKSNKTTARQSIVLDSTNKTLIEATTTALQAQEGKVVNTVSYVSKQAKQKFFEELFTKAYNNAYSKAKFITKVANGEDLEVKRIDYYMNENQIRPMHRMMSAQAMSADAMPEIQVDNSPKELLLNLTLSFEFETKDHK